MGGWQTCLSQRRGPDRQASHGLGGVEERERAMVVFVAEVSVDVVVD